MNENIIQLRLISFFLLITLSLNSEVLYADISNQHESTASGFDKNYEKKLLWGERYLSLKLNNLALKKFEEAAKIKPGAYYPKYRIKQLSNKAKQSTPSYLNNFVFDINKPGFLIGTLVFVILFSLISMVIALIAVLLNRNQMEKTEKRKQYLREEYQTLLVNFLFSKEISEEFVGKMQNVASDNFNRKVLIDQMIDLSVTLTGEEKDRLKKLYVRLRLDKDSYNKAMSRKWHVKAKGFRELAFMNIPVANDEIKRCLRSKNDILRQEAQFALIRLYPDDSFVFLNELNKKYTLWEQLNVYEIITFHDLKLPDFEHLLHSQNNSIVMFSLRMIKVFRLIKTFNTMVGLLSHDNAQIRNLTIHVLGALKLNESLPYLKKIYKNETYENCIAIIQAMASINNESMLNFFKLVLDKEDDVQLQIEAAIAINKIGIIGSETLNNLLKSDYKNYQIIVKHVLDKRIN